MSTPTLKSPQLQRKDLGPDHTKTQYNSNNYQIHSNVSNMFGNWTIGVPKEFKQLVYVSTAAFC